MCSFVDFFFYVLSRDHGLFTDSTAWSWEAWSCQWVESGSSQAVSSLLLSFSTECLISAKEFIFLGPDVSLDTSEANQQCG